PRRDVDRERRYDRELSHHVAVRKLRFTTYDRHADFDRNAGDTIRRPCEEGRWTGRTMEKLVIAHRIAIVLDRGTREVRPRERNSAWDGDSRYEIHALIAPQYRRSIPTRFNCCPRRCDSEHGWVQVHGAVIRQAQRHVERLSRDYRLHCLPWGVGCRLST